MKKAFIGALIVSAMSVVQASAATIDFTDLSWKPVGFDSSITNGDVTAESRPDGVSVLNHDDANGLGVSTIWNPGGQIGPVEMLDVTFAQPFTLTNFTVSQLYRTCYSIVCVNEVGYYRVNGGAWQEFTANSTGGNLLVTLAPTLVTSLQFGVNPASLNDFRVKELNGDFSQPAAVPEPTSMVLLGTGLLGLVARARRKNRA